LAGLVRYLGVLYRDSRSFSAVRRWLVDRRERRVRRSGRVSAGRCILHDLRLLERVRWAWVRRFRLRGLRGRVRDRVVRRDGRGSAMFRAA
jgi:hypothetical protein